MERSTADRTKGVPAKKVNRQESNREGKRDDVEKKQVRRLLQKGRIHFFPKKERREEGKKMVTR